MKAYFTTSYSYRVDNKGEYELLTKALNQIFGDGNVFYADDKIDIELEENDEKSILGSVKTRQDALKNADVLIADITDGSAGVGYNIHTALSLKKPVLVLREKSESKKRVHHPITTGKIKLITYKEYSNQEEAKLHIRKFMNGARKMLDTKFILIISPEIDRYLEWAADNKRMHKAQIVREAVEDMMTKDQEYKKAAKDEA
jgi:hypothetical protein